MIFRNNVVNAKFLEAFTMKLKRDNLFILKNLPYQFTSQRTKQNLSSCIQIMLGYNVEIL